MAPPPLPLPLPSTTQLGLGRGAVGPADLYMPGTQRESNYLRVGQVGSDSANVDQPSEEFFGSSQDAEGDTDLEYM